MSAKEAERYARYAEAVNTIVGYPSETMVRAVMAVADAELQEQQPDPLVGRLMAFTDPDTGRIIAAGKVTEVKRADSGMEMTTLEAIAAGIDGHAGCDLVVGDGRLTLQPAVWINPLAPRQR